MEKDIFRFAMKEAPIGYAYQKVICDQNGEPYDYEFIDVNAAFADFFFLSENELIGKRFSLIFPQLYETKPEWIRLVGEIAVSGGQKELELFSDVFNQWIRIKILSPDTNYFILYLLDIQKDDEEASALGHSEIFNGAEQKTKNAGEDGRVWEKRLTEIADILKLENDLQFQRIIENLPFSLDIISLDGIILYANAKCLELFELDENAIGTRTTNDLWVEPAKHDLWIETLGREGVVNDFDMHLRTATGKEFWAIGSGILIQYQDKTCVLSTQVNITERKRMESALKTSEEKYRLLTEFTSDVIWVLNLKKQKFTYISPSICYLTGQTAEEAIDMNLTDSLTPESAIIVREAIELHLQEFLKNPENQKSYILEIRQKCKNGEVIWVEVSTKYRFNDAGDIEIVGVSRNIEERKRAEREVLYLSYHDQLTGLYNRRYYEEELQRINFHRNLPLTLVIADVNGLKLTNDAFGHMAGDELLKQFTTIINRHLRAEDMAARIGGDEFVLLLPKMDTAEAETLVRRIKEEIQNARPEHAILSVSFGWATKNSVDENFAAIFIQAEDSMYHTKLIESMNMKNETIRLAMKKLYRKNVVEQHHAEQVARLCVEIGKAMNLSKEELRDLELLGRMHDIGKIGVQEDILKKKNKLSETEWLEVRRHPEIGYQILRSADEYVQIAESVLYHQERADGKGYPRGLKLDEIPLHARILAVAEAYDAMVYGDRYRDDSKENSAVNELIANAGTQFDREIVDIFIEKVLGKQRKPQILEA
jgi:diguanylate cyclase (GGDEF)-like protein/PAS domain S-box-containing protein